MCLSTVDFNLSLTKGGLVGIGYKILSDDYEYKLNKWMRARHRNYTKKYLEIDSCDDKKYTVGFHIFLNIEDAIDYRKMLPTFNFNTLVRVEFKVVTGFGTNETGASARQAKCVIAQQMRVVEILKEFK